MVAVHSITTKITNQKALRQAAQLSEPPHSRPSHSGTRPPHCSFPPVALATDHHQLQIEYSLIRLFVLGLRGAAVNTVVKRDNINEN